MAVAIRLSRQGSKKRPFYRIVAAEKSSPRDGRFIELLGTYDPRTKHVQLKLDRYAHWLTTGALPSDTVASLYRRSVREIEAEQAAAPPKAGKATRGKARQPAPAKAAATPEPAPTKAEAAPEPAPAQPEPAQAEAAPAQPESAAQAPEQAEAAPADAE